MFFELFIWWYGPGWLSAWRKARDWITAVQMEFSAPILLKTLFSPWKQIVTAPGRSIDEKFKALIDNLISRCVGFLVRFFALLAACVLTVMAGLAGLAMATAWPFVPVAIVYLIFRTITG